MAITSDHMTGFVVGVGVSAFGIYLYKKNHRQVNEFLRTHGIEVEEDCSYAEMTLEQLVLEKERLEDLIAEREIEPQKE